MGAGLCEERWEAVFNAVAHEVEQLVGRRSFKSPNLIIS